MFYITRQAKQRRRDLALMHIGPTIIVFVAFFGLTVWNSLDAGRTVKKTRTEIATRNLEQTKSTIQERFSTYEDILRSGAGFFNGSDNVTREEWKQFVNNFELRKRYPGVQGVGYTQIVQPDQLDSHIQSIRDQGLPEYTVFPTGVRPIYASVIYIEPMNESNQKAIGYDMYSESRRQKTMFLARDSGQPTLSDTVSLVSEGPTNKQPGLLLFVPVYDHGSQPATVAERRQHLTGFIYAPFRTYDYFSNTVKNTDENFGFQIHDANNSSNSLLYESAKYKQITNTPGYEALTHTLKINNHDWTITGVIHPNIIPARERSRPFSVLWGGLLFSIFVAGFMYLLLLNRTRLLATKEEHEIDTAKDELLALASHQLRTPATGVKQYIGMLLEGYAGDISPEQREYLDKAYASNERQLGTINEMLSVARADAGNIQLAIENFNITDLVKEVIEEHRNAINTRKQKLNKVFTPKKLLYDGDPRYLRMAIDNIISNATKYTPEKGTIKITVESIKQSINITVKDSGVGVNKADFPMLFQKFSRIPNDLTNKVSGSGIGLYLAQKIVEAHDGTISFDSQENIGSTCTIKLPIIKNKGKV